MRLNCIYYDIKLYVMLECQIMCDSGFAVCELGFANSRFVKFMPIFQRSGFSTRPKARARECRRLIRVDLHIELHQTDESRIERSMEGTDEFHYKSRITARNRSLCCIYGINHFHFFELFK